MREPECADVKAAAEGENSSSARPDPHGTEPISPLDENEPTLAGCLLALIQRLDILIDQNAMLIEAMLDSEPEQEGTPNTYMNGNRIS